MVLRKMYKNNMFYVILCYVIVQFSLVVSKTIKHVVFHNRAFHSNQSVWQEINYWSDREWYKGKNVANSLHVLTATQEVAVKRAVQVSFLF